MDEIIKIIIEYLKSIGVKPLIMLVILFFIAVICLYLTYKIDKEKEKYKKELEFLAEKQKKELEFLAEKHNKALEFLAERQNKRAELLEELNGHVHNFDHYVDHVFQGDGGWYRTAIDEKYVNIRELSRVKIELIENDFPEFLDLIYDFTANGRLILDGHFDVNNYKDAKNALNALFSDIRGTLPGMRNCTK